ncbi:MAG: hypothetical protein ACK5YO_17525, partial [Planctomyces sp.]
GGGRSRENEDRQFLPTVECGDSVTQLRAGVAGPARRFPRQSAFAGARVSGRLSEEDAVRIRSLGDERAWTFGGGSWW